MRILAIILAFLATTVWNSPQVKLQQATGKITMIRATDSGDWSGYGAEPDKIYAEAVITLDTRAGFGFGFQLQNDENLPARNGMLGLLRDGFNHNWTITIDYEIQEGKKNGYIKRVELRK